MTNDIRIVTLHSMSTPPTNTDERLDAILDHLARMDRRDRLRTIGGFFRGLLGLIPIIILLGSVWYAYQYGDELLAKITKQAAEQAAAATQQGAGNLMEKLELMLPQ
jgi:hypothetical protein